MKQEVVWSTKRPEKGWEIEVDLCLLRPSLSPEIHCWYDIQFVVMEDWRNQKWLKFMKPISEVLPFYVLLKPYFKILRVTIKISDDYFQWVTQAALVSTHTPVHSTHRTAFFVAVFFGSLVLYAKGKINEQRVLDEILTVLSPLMLFFHQHKNTVILSSVKNVTMSLSRATWPQYLFRKMSTGCQDMSHSL